MAIEYLNQRLLIFLSKLQNEIIIIQYLLGLESSCSFEQSLTHYMTSKEANPNTEKLSSVVYQQVKKCGFSVSGNVIILFLTSHNL